MDKVYSNKDVEEKIYKSWEEKGYFKANPTSHILSLKNWRVDNSKKGL